MLKKKFLFLLGIGFIGILNAQQLKKERKKATTTRVSRAPTIDGILDDEAWKNTALLSDFVTFRPDNGKTVSAAYQTTVKVVYDDAAIYISATMLDPDATNIPQEFASRDNFSQADFFLVTINPNDDGQNPFEFIVQSTGNQSDAKISNGNEDFNWNLDLNYIWQFAPGSQLIAFYRNSIFNDDTNANLSFFENLK